MKRIHLFEFTDLSCYPSTFRRIQTDYLQFVSTLGSGHHFLIPLFSKALHHAGTTEIVDLCSGGTGPWLRLQEQLKQAGLLVSVRLTDKYPDPQAAQKWLKASSQDIEYLTEPVDATDVPDHLHGMRSLFEGFHHFPPSAARSILQDAFKKKAAIGVFEANLKPPWKPFLIVISPVITLLAYFFFTPFIKPLTLSRFIWTYLLPLVPLATCWDGIVSMLRVYSPDELQELTNPFQSEDYIWEIGEASTGTPVFLFTYLVGYPA